MYNHPTNKTTPLTRPLCLVLQVVALAGFCCILYIYVCVHNWQIYLFIISRYTVLLLGRLSISRMMEQRQKKCISAVIYNEGIHYFRQQNDVSIKDTSCSVDPEMDIGQGHESQELGQGDITEQSKKTLFEIFASGDVFSLSAGNSGTGLAANISHQARHRQLIGELRKLHSADIFSGFTFIDDGPDDYKNCCFVSFSKESNKESNIENVTDKAKKYGQTYFFHYRTVGVKVIQELIRTENKRTIDQYELVPAPPPQVHPIYLAEGHSAVFRSVEGAIQVLQEHGTPEAEEVLRVAEKCMEVPETDNPRAHPVIVVEGLDATGKTTLTENLESELKAKLFKSPPDVLLHVRPHFDSQPELVRRAYFTIANYLASRQIRQAAAESTVIIDRFWHSTTAYTLASETAGCDVSALPPVGHWVYNWPEALDVPDVAILLTVPEEVRKRRMRIRGEVETEDEKKLHKNIFRARLLEAYRRMRAPRLTEIDASPSPEEVVQLAMQEIKRHCQL